MTAVRPDASAHAQPLHVLGALALELRGDAPVARAILAQAEAGELVEHMARDLATFAPEAAQLQLVTVGAHYDPVELLRPGWALHRELDQLAARAPGDAAGRDHRVWCARRDSCLAPWRPRRITSAVRCDWCRSCSAATPDVVARVGDRFERELIERGMAGADTALAAQEAFGLQIEHARYLTAHDLAAMTALQYEHAGLAPLWPLLETALLDPDGEAWLDALPEPLLHYADGEARIAHVRAARLEAALRGRGALRLAGRPRTAGTPARALPGAPAPDRGRAGCARRRGDVRALRRANRRRAGAIAAGLEPPLQTRRLKTASDRTGRLKPAATASAWITPHATRAPALPAGWLW